MENTEKLNQLKKAISASFEKMKNANYENLQSIFAQYQQAKQELIDYENSLITPEQRELEMLFNEITEQKRVIDEKHAELKKKLIELMPSKNNGLPESHARKMSYETVQEIREKISKGSKISDLAKEYSCSTAAIGYYKNYLQHKLRKGDMAFTPLVNDYYPFGAPYADDAVKEDGSRYTIKKWKVSDIINDINNGMPKSDAARKYALSVANLERMIAE